MRGRAVAKGHGGVAALNDEKVGVRETLKSATKSIDWKVTMKKQVQLLFSIWKRMHLYIQKGSSLICKGCGRTDFTGGSPS